MLAGAGWGYLRGRPDVFIAAAADQMADAIERYMTHGSMNNYWAVKEAAEKYRVACKSDMGRVDL